MTCWTKSPDWSCPSGAGGRRLCSWPTGGSWFSLRCPLSVALINSYCKSIQTEPIHHNTWQVVDLHGHNGWQVTLLVGIGEIVRRKSEVLRVVLQSDVEIFHFRTGNPDVLINLKLDERAFSYYKFYQCVFSIRTTSVGSWRIAVFKLAGIARSSDSISSLV